MKRLIHLVLPFLILGNTAIGQLYKGPASGSVASGASVTTNSFLPEAPGTYPGPLMKEPRNKFTVDLLPDRPGAFSPAPAMRSKENLDRRLPATTLTIPPIELGTFPGIPDLGNIIPPDPYLAVGPNHVIATVNSRFRIWDKAGNVLKTIDAVAWFTNVFPNSGCFDPKVLYDQLANRWIMVWLQQRDSDSSSHYLLSVSDDDNPLGTWYNWVLPGNVNGSTPESPIKNWSDYQGVGYDKDAIYFTSNQFGFDGNFDYVKIRIIPKAQLYANTGGAVTWTDLWDIRDPAGNVVFGTRPARIHGTPNEYYLISDSRFSTATYMTLYRLTTPLTTPKLRAYNVTVATHTSPAQANQLGGSTTLLESGGRGIRNEPVYMDSSLWVVHCVASGPANAFSSVRYVRINLLDSTAAEDATLGTDSSWYFYPALAVDKDKNVAITYSRSGVSEYVGAHITWHYSQDLPSTLGPSFPIKAGKANYVKTFGSGRNRWGDYNGVWLDPADPNDFWVFTEYAESPANTWATWLYHMRLVPYAGPKIFSETKSVDFGLVEAGLASDTVRIVLHNYGDSPLTFSSIAATLPEFKLIDLPSFPATIGTFDSIAIRASFVPSAHGVILDSISFATNDPGTPVARITLRGKGVSIGRALAGTMYGTAITPANQLYTIDLSTGVSTPVGSLGIPEIDGLTIRPFTAEIYGVASGTSTSTLYRISVAHGDALQRTSIPLANLRAVAFSPSDVLYAATTSGKIYQVNPQTGDTTYVGPSGLNISSLAFRPGSGELWASVRPAVANKDKIYKISTTNGAATLVGGTGLNAITPHIAFSANGNLYAIIGTSSQVSKLYALDTTTALATLIGTSNVTGILAITLRTDSTLTSVGDKAGDRVPSVYALDQNYPNPFNPVTQIRFALPRQSVVMLAIYNIVGQRIATLVNDVKSAGYHDVFWDGRTEAGSSVASGIYFYRLEAHASDGGPSGNFTEIKKMVLLK